MILRLFEINIDIPSNKTRYFTIGNLSQNVIQLFSKITDFMARMPIDSSSNVSIGVFGHIYPQIFHFPFDRVRHSTLMQKVAVLDIPDNVYNWMVDLLNGHSHCTVYSGTRPTSAFWTTQRVSYKAPALDLQHMSLIPVISRQPLQAILSINSLMIPI